MRQVAVSTDEQVILVDAHDQEIGVEEKLEAHRKGLRHRAFSIFIFRHVGESLELLLQKRSRKKYHCGGLWTNTCCSHPRPGEDLLSAANRRLKTEMGMVAQLRPVGKFHYHVSLDGGYSENEVDHVFVGFCEVIQVPDFSLDEVEETKWMLVDILQKDLVKNPGIYTPWFKPALDIAVAVEKSTYQYSLRVGHCAE